jgi:hypothetical protein
MVVKPPRDGGDADAGHQTASWSPALRDGGKQENRSRTEAAAVVLDPSQLFLNPDGWSVNPVATLVMLMDSEIRHGEHLDYCKCCGISLIDHARNKCV